MFNFFKKKEKKKNINDYKFHQVFVKMKKDANLYIGQFLSIDVDEDDEDDKNTKYYFSSYQNGIVTSKIQKEHEKCCEKYNYGIVKSINDDIVEVLIICVNGYLQRYKIELNSEYHDGNSFIIKDGILYDNNNVVGKIIDNRYNPNIPILLNAIDKNILTVFIKK